MIKILIFLLTPFRRVFIRSGIDFDRMITIMKFRLIVDSRRTARVYSGKEKKGDVSNSQIKVALSMAFSISIFFLIMSSKVADLRTLLLIYHSLLMLFMLTTIMTEYSGFIFDNQDSQILMRMPVNSKTIWSAKFCCMLFYFLFYTIAGALIPSIFIGFKEGVIHGFMLMGSSIFNVIFTLLFVNFLFLILMRFVKPDKYQKIINGIQMTVLIVVLMGYMLTNSFVEERGLALDPGVWGTLLPPAWFSAFNLIILGGDTMMWMMLVEGVLIPVLAIYAILRWFAPYLSSRIVETDQSAFYGGDKMRKKSKIMPYLASLFTRKPISRAGFEFSWNLSSGNKLYFETTMPMVVYTIVFSGIQFFRIIKDGVGENAIEGGINSVIGLYFTFFAAYAIVDSMQYTRNGMFLWFFQSKPLEKPGQFLIGALKGVYIKYFLPIFIIVAAINLYFMGIANILHVWFAFSAITIFAMLSLRIVPVFPFSKERERMTSGKYFVIMLVVMIGAGIFAVIQVFLAKIDYGIEVASIILLILLWLTGRSFNNISWRKIIKQY